MLRRRAFPRHRGGDKIMSMMKKRTRPTALGVLGGALAMLVLVMLAACDSERQVQGGASDHGAGGRVKLGLPF
jgi:hypothetical protein